MGSFFLRGTLIEDLYLFLDVSDGLQQDTFLSEESEGAERDVTLVLVAGQVYVAGCTRM